jgi:hypothetical protein
MPVDKATFVRQLTERMDTREDPDERVDLLLDALRAEGGYGPLIDAYEAARYG